MYLENNNLLSNFQFGFRSCRSTEIAATIFTDHIRTAMDEGKFTGAIYVDLSKAFDTISHSILLKTLREKGIAGMFNRLSFLSDAASVILWDNFISSVNIIWSATRIHPRTSAFHNLFQRCCEIDHTIKGFNVCG